MKAASLLLLMTALGAGGSETVLPATRQAHLLILQEVYLNGVGPFRMIIDTGNASSLVRPAVARRLGLAASGEVEQVSPAGARRVPVSILRELRTGAVADQAVEVMIAEPFLPGIDGALGQSWLVRHNYLVDLRGERLVLDGPAPDAGLRIALRSGEGVPAVAMEVDGRRRTLAIDSGAPAVVLFETAVTARKTLVVSTNAGHAAAAAGTVSIVAGGAPAWRLPAVRIETPGRAGGLLPACAFSAVYVSNSEGFVALIR